MKHWPKSAYLAFVTLTLLYGLFSVGLYTSTKENYEKIGTYNGKIQQTDNMIATIQAAVPIPRCDETQNNEHPIELLNVKTETVYMVVAQDDSVRFCGYVEPLEGKRIR